MRHFEILILHHLITRQNQIEIERARRTWVRPCTASGVFNRAQRVEHFARRQRRLPYSNGVQIRRIALESRADWCGFDDGGKTETGEDG